MTFRSRDWQILIVFGIFLALLFFVGNYDWHEIAIRQREHKPWELRAAELGFAIFIGINVIHSLTRRLGSRVEIRDGVLVQQTWRGKVLAGGRLDTITELGIRKPIGFTTYVRVSFGNHKPMQIDAEYQNFKSLINALELSSGHKAIPIRSTH